MSAERVCLPAGELRTSRLLDRETLPRYSLAAHVQDRERPDWECVSHIDIILSDVNDNPPNFSTANHTAALPEDSPVGTLITKMHATDPDRGKVMNIFQFFLNNSLGLPKYRLMFK